MRTRGRPATPANELTNRNGRIDVRLSIPLEVAEQVDAYVASHREVAGRSALLSALACRAWVALRRREAREAAEQKQAAEQSGTTQD